MTAEQALMSLAVLALGLVAAWAANWALARSARPRRSDVFDVDDGERDRRDEVRTALIGAGVLLAAAGLFVAACWGIVALFRHAPAWAVVTVAGAIVLAGLLAYVARREQATGQPMMDDYVELPRVDVIPADSDRREVSR